jgi:hypothetical protein
MGPASPGAREVGVGAGQPLLVVQLLVHVGLGQQVINLRDAGVPTAVSTPRPHPPSPTFHVKHSGKSMRRRALYRPYVRMPIG